MLSCQWLTLSLIRIQLPKATSRQSPTPPSKHSSMIHHNHPFNSATPFSTPLPSHLPFTAPPSLFALSTHHPAASVFSPFTTHPYTPLAFCHLPLLPINHVHIPSTPQFDRPLINRPLSPLPHPLSHTPFRPYPSPYPLSSLHRLAAYDPYS